MSNTGGTEQPVSVESKVKFTDAAVEEAKLSLDESGIRTTDSEFKAATATGAFSSTGKHSLKSTQRGESGIEKLAAKMETRRANRIAITFEIRKEFLRMCRKIAQEEGLKSKIPYHRLVRLRDELKVKIEEKENILSAENKRRMSSTFGFLDTDVVMLSLFERGVVNGRAVDASWFFFRDFNFYHTCLANKITALQSPALSAITWLLLFYFGSAVFFCAIIDDDQVCPCKNGDLSRKEFKGTEDCPAYEGWVSTIYFASVTMSTVGYGDISLSGQENWRTFIGVVYMLVALTVGYTVFATAAEMAIGGFGMDGSGRVTSVLFRSCVENYDGTSTPLYMQVRRVTLLRVVELVSCFFALNFFGLLIARPFVNRAEEEEEDWNWMTTFYWAVQTTTTIGYGDLSMPFDLRWFNIFFTTLGTAFVGSVFGGIASLKNDISDLRRYYAWKRREVSKRLIEDMKGNDSDNRLDQYEFMVGSLLMLNKIEQSDVEQIMDKFREMAGQKGYIEYMDAVKEADKAETLAVEVLAEEGDFDGGDKQAELEDMRCDVDITETRF